VAANTERPGDGRPPEGTSGLDRNGGRWPEVTYVTQRGAERRTARGRAGDPLGQVTNAASQVETEIANNGTASGDSGLRTAGLPSVAVRISKEGPCIASRCFRG